MQATIWVATKINGWDCPRIAPFYPLAYDCERDALVIAGSGSGLRRGRSIGEKGFQDGDP